MRESFVFFRSFFEAINCFDDDKAKLRLYSAFCNYALNGIQPKNLKNEEMATFLLFMFIQDKYSILNNKDYRHSIAYQVWRKGVLEKDFYTCQMCGNSENLHAHHIIPFAKDIDKRFDIDNGITLCEKCHKQVHRRNSDGGGQ
jgi:hypothetical protein